MTPEEKKEKKRLDNNRRQREFWARKKAGAVPGDPTTTCRPLKNLAVGESYFYLRPGKVQELQNTIGRFFRRRRWHYITRTTEEEAGPGVRVWRVASPPPEIKASRLHRYPHRAADDGILVFDL